MRAKGIVVLLFLLWTVAVTAQTNEDWDELMETLSEDYASAADDDEADEGWQALVEELADLHEHPFDINSATREMLAALPFLTFKEVDAIMDYRAINGPLRSIGELRLIGALNSYQLRWLRLFVCVESPMTDDSRTPMKSVRQEVTTRIDVPCYDRAGWPWARGIAHRLRYTGQWSPHLDIALRGEKDAGEPMFTRKNPLWDSWGGHVMFSDWRAVQTVIVGDYRAAFGEGLVMNNGFQLGKQLTGLWRSSASLKPHRSYDESRYLRGIAAALRLGRGWNVTALYAFRRLDATVQPDNTVRSINDAGLHRTEAEMSHRRTLGNHTAALHAAWQQKSLRLGATATYNRYDHQFRQGTALYRQIYPEGYEFAAVGADYAAHVASLYVSGETAHSWGRQGNGWATLNKATWRFDSNTRVAAVQRFYSKLYYSPQATAFGESDRVQNESGVALYFDADRLGPFGINVFFDYFYHPWPRFTMTKASTGYEAALQGSFQPRKDTKYLVRYSLKSKEKSDTRHVSHRLRASFIRQWHQRWTLRATALMHHYVEPVTHERSTGYALLPRLDFASADERWRSSLMAGWFDSKTYNSRLYTFEPSLLQTFGLSMLYGRGERVALTMSWHSPRLAVESPSITDDSSATTDPKTRQVRRYQPSCFHLQLKIGLTHYHDRTTISSGPTLIRSPFRCDLQLLLRYTFRGVKR